MMLLTYAVPLLWLIASAAAFFLVFKPQPRWPLVGTPARALVAFVLVFAVGGALTAVTRPDDTPPPRPAAPPPPKTPKTPDPILVRAHPETYLTLGRVTMIKGKAGAVLATGAATNTSGLPLREPVLHCDMMRGDNVEGSVSATVQATVPPGGQVIFAAISMGQFDGPWERGDCKIAKVQVD